MPFLLLTIVPEFCGVRRQRVMEQMAINAEGMAVNSKMCRDLRIFYLRNLSRMLRIFSGNAWTCRVRHCASPATNGLSMVITFRAVTDAAMMRHKRAEEISELY
ncbi:hypothetical protein AL522_14650 [Pantoea vagans]|nr:hypothetical protein AL522_14650 [Pantoea vagans]